MSNQSTNNRLWTKDFIFITFVNLFMYLIHYMLVVTITEYTIDKYHASESIGGLAAGIFIIGMLAGRLGSGRIIDHLQPKWYRVPLETEHEEVNTLLAMIITTTPGTVSAGIDQERGDILVHALSSDNAELDIQEIKNRYETPLLEIFNVKPMQGVEQ